ncbi:MAG TPA: redoxin domain-containing protein [Candidatus Kapabacteria bacterium]|nr:redoxin domain-containing protein [Candidatus Kapabacteria bacterium]
MKNVGEKFQDFELKDQDNKNFKTANLRGKKILLSFHPLAFTPVCADQMKSLEDNKKTFAELNTVPLGINVDQPFAKAAWAKELDIEDVRLLADFWPHGAVAKSLDLFLEKEGFSERANIIIDEEGKIIFAKSYKISELPDIKEIIEFLQDYESNK